jgi:hypothetical protein
VVVVTWPLTRTKEASSSCLRSRLGPLGCAGQLRSCQQADLCQGHGTCQSDGTCLCDQHFYPPYCSAVPTNIVRPLSQPRSVTAPATGSRSLYLLTRHSLPAKLR